jgi:hypothetical protein
MMDGARSRAGPGWARANAIVFLACEDAARITGQAPSVAGGPTMNG